MITIINQILHDIWSEKWKEGVYYKYPQWVWISDITIDSATYNKDFIIRLIINWLGIFKDELL